MAEQKKFLCNKLYEYLFSEEIARQVTFLKDDDFRDPGRDFSGVEGVLAQPFLITKDFLDRAPDLNWIQVTGAGYDAADVGEIRRRGLTLTNSRGVMSRSIAEDVLCKILFFTRKVREVEQNKRDHKWNSFGQDQWMCKCYTDIFGKKLGIVGYGSLGHEVAIRAKAFGMDIRAYDVKKYDEPELTECYTDAAGLDKLLRESDFVLLTIPLFDSTFHMINDEVFDKMKPTAMLINVSRGPIVDERALESALREGKIAWAACDVFEQEPLSADSPLWELPNIFITSHKAGMGDTWTYFIGQLMERNIGHYLAGEPLENVINLSVH